MLAGHVTASRAKTPHLKPLPEYRERKKGVNMEGAGALAQGRSDPAIGLTAHPIAFRLAR
jgi:hypothetical protein